MSNAASTPGREPRNVAASLFLGHGMDHLELAYWNAFIKLQIRL